MEPSSGNTSSVLEWGAKVTEKVRMGMILECNIKQDEKYINRQAFNNYLCNRTNKKSIKREKRLTTRYATGLRSLEKE